MCGQISTVYTHLCERERIRASFPTASSQLDARRIRERLNSGADLHRGRFEKTKLDQTPHIPVLLSLGLWWTPGWCRSQAAQKLDDTQTKDLFSFALIPVWFTKLPVLTRAKICFPNPAGLIFNLRSVSEGYLFGPDGLGNVVLEPAGIWGLQKECPNYCLISAWATRHTWIMQVDCD